MAIGLRRFSIAASIGSVLMLQAGASAHAAAYSSFDLTGPSENSTGTSQNHPQSRQFSGVGNVSGATIKAFGFYTRDDGSVHGPAGITKTADGLGVRGKLDNNNNAGGAIEDSGNRDWLVLSLPSPKWRPVAMTFGGLGDSSKYDVYGYNGELNAGDSTGFRNALRDGLFEKLVLGGGSASLSFLGVTTQQYLYIIIAPHDTNGDDLFDGEAEVDRFRVSGFTGSVDVLQSVQAVPLPATMPLLLIGLVGFGFMRGVPRVWPRHRV